MQQPEKERRFSWRARGRSFVFAWSGIVRFFRAEHNAWIHLGATLVVVMLACVLRVSRMEAVALVLAMALVWLTEMLNTAVEKIMDHLSPGIHPQVKTIKDVAAGAVLVAAVAAAITGAIIFLPKIVAALQ